MMKTMTTSSDCLLNSDDSLTYLTWKEMEWNLFGGVVEYNASINDVCKEYDGLTNVFLPGFFQSKIYILIKKYV